MCHLHLTVDSRCYCHLLIDGPCFDNPHVTMIWHCCAVQSIDHIPHSLVLVRNIDHQFDDLLVIDQNCMAPVTVQKSQFPAAVAQQHHHFLGAAAQKKCGIHLKIQVYNHLCPVHHLKVSLHYF